MRAVAAAVGSLLNPWGHEVKGSWGLAGNLVQGGPSSRQAVRGALDGAQVWEWSGAQAGRPGPAVRRAVKGK